MHDLFREAPFYQEQELLQEGREVGTEKNTAHFARYLHGDMPVDRHLGRDGNEIKNGMEQKNRSKIDYTVYFSRSKEMHHVR